MLVLEFGQIVKGAVEREGMLGWQYNTVGVSDAITMGGEGITKAHHRETPLLHVYTLSIYICVCVCIMLSKLTALPL
jgi:dihydroxyacid dehydratase/phosphogluconate dehydratase